MSTGQPAHPSGSYHRIGVHIVRLQLGRNDHDHRHDAALVALQRGPDAIGHADADQQDGDVGPCQCRCDERLDLLGGGVCKRNVLSGDSRAHSCSGVRFSTII